MPGELAPAHVAEIIDELPADFTDRSPDFNDETGNYGYVVWRKKDGMELPKYAQSALNGLHRVQVKHQNLRSIQINLQQPRGKQKAHKDDNFSSSMTFHLSPDGLFEYEIPGTTQNLAIPTGIGDVVAMTRANETMHNGRNLSHISRYTLSMFFNGKAFTL